MKGRFTGFWFIGINHTWIDHKDYIKTVSDIEFFKCETWRLMFTIGRWGVYLKEIGE